MTHKTNKRQTYYVKTFGCQMNVADSERIAGYYEQKGYLLAKKIEDAVEVIINTCSVRQSAEDRVDGLINNIIKQKTKDKRQKIILSGCMLRGSEGELKKRYPGIDKFLKIEDLGFGTPARRDDKKHAWVPISQGCNNFCTYCVVPYARGREKSRPFEEIVCEVEELVKRGYKEITLLGQNVNSYGKDISNSDLKTQISKLKLKTTNFITPFAVLLTCLNNIDGLEKIKFMTSNPWDLDSDIIQSIKLPKIEKYLHLPVQSGDDEILTKMNRHYTSADYLSLINQIRKEIPNIEIGTDIIVGFPGETEEQFQNTVELCKKSNFSIAYISIYSPRPGTVAYRMEDNIPHKEKRRRWIILNDLINKPS